MTLLRFLLLAQAALFLFAGPAAAEAMPDGIRRQLPADYRVLASAEAEFAGPSHTRFIVVLARQNDAADPFRPAPDRPLLIFERQADGRFRQVARNTRVAMPADAGGQCDPFDP